MNEPNPELVKFIQKARNLGYSDQKIKEALEKEGWKISQINNAYLKANQSNQKNRITINLDSKVLKQIEKRAGKNLLSIEEQIEDIIRRSCVRKGQVKLYQEKLDDLLIGIFSRKKNN